MANAKGTAFAVFRGMSKRKFRLKNLGKIFMTAFKSWNSKDPFRESAVISYYAIFSLPALLAIVVAIAGLVFGQEAVTGTLSDQIGAAMSPGAAEEVENMIAKASETKSSVWATIIGVITLIFGATGVFVQFQKSLDRIWEVKPDPKKEGFMSMIRERVFSFGLVVSIGFLLLVSLVITSVLSALADWAEARFPDYLLFIFAAINFLVSFAVITVLFALMFKVLPHAKTKWRDVWVGSALTAMLFVIGKFGLGFYFGKADPASAYGAAGSIILILLWVSYSSMIVFFGAEFTKAYTEINEGKIKPAENAVSTPGLAKDMDRASRAMGDETRKPSGR